MRYVIGLTALLATPANAHHEVAVVASALPLASGAALVAAVAAATFRKRIKWAAKHWFSASQGRK